MLNILADIFGIGMLLAIPAYRAYKQIKALNQNKYDPAKNQQIYKHCIVYALFRVSRWIEDVFSVVPYYGVFKIIIIIWLTCFGGIDYCYRRVVRRTLMKYEAKIDDFNERYSVPRNSAPKIRTKQQPKKNSRKNSPKRNTKK
ncbi:TB2/DP1/HVA22-related protein [Cinara cedri]|uniref:Receptor expression-enhancing protein n=1 Tax=Cinara cedri TaxID=506608 RepID=A0A5E4LY78_9HEMI|nr:TB2/DP1/HVA22-related protein [Cinara cedri]